MENLSYTVVPLSKPFAQVQFVAPPSKSCSQRALACALISSNVTEIQGLGYSDDEEAVLGVLNELGCEVFQGENVIRVYSKGIVNLEEQSIDCNESGLATRMLIPILSNSKAKITVNGRGSLLNRSISLYDTFFKNCQVEFSSNEGKLPAQIGGPLVPISMEIDASHSSQYITGLILAYCGSPLLTQAVLVCKNPVSVPYIELTLDLLKQFGVDLAFENNVLQFNGPYDFEASTIRIEGDWSSVSFLLAAAAINGDIKIAGLNRKSVQADRQFLDALERFGTKVTWEDSDLLHVQKGERHAFEFDATNCPDLFPPLAVIATFGKGVSRIKGVHRLLDKESNRAIAIQQEWSKFGIQINLVDDYMEVVGQRQLKINEEIQAHGDHRIAMGTSILGLFAANKTVIQGANAVNKSFPEFFTYLEKIN